MPNAVVVAQSGLQGWRAKLADGVAEPISRHTGLDEDQVRGGIGALFVGLAVLYLYKTLRSVKRELQS